MNILNDPKFINIHDEHEWQRYELFRRYEQLLPNKNSSPIKTQSMPSSASSSFEQTNTPFNIKLINIKDFKSKYLFFFCLVINKNFN